jgi:hypothetical protein
MATKKTSAKKKSVSRHGMRAPGKTQTSITLSEELLDQARVVAEQDGRSLSNWLEQLIRKRLS